MGTTSKPQKGSMGCTGWIFLLAFGTAGSAIAIFSIFWIVAQQRVHSDYIPIHGKVIYSRVLISRSHDGNTYGPDIKYRYKINGKHYTSKKDMAFSYSSSSDWARHIVAHYKHGRGCIVYVNPADPSQAVLLNTISFLPYGLWFFGMIFVIAGVGTFLFMRTGDKWALSGAGDSLNPTAVATLTRRRRRVMIFMVIFLIPAMVVMGDYFAISKPPWFWLPDLFAALIIAAFIAGLWYLWCSFRVGAVMDEPQVTTAPTPAIIGGPVACVVNVTWKKAVKVKSANAIIRCVQTQTCKAGNSSETNVNNVVWKDQQDLSGPTDYATGDSANNWAAQFSIPAEMMPTGHFNQAMMANFSMPMGMSMPGSVGNTITRLGAVGSFTIDCHWEFLITIKFISLPTYHGKFRFEVASAAPAV